MYHITFITACAQNVFLQHERKRWTLMPLAKSTFNNARPRAAHSLLMRRYFQFVDVEYENEYY